MRGKTTEVSRIRVFARCWPRIQFYFEHFKVFSFQFWCVGVNDSAETPLLWIGGISFIISGLRSVLPTVCLILSAVPGTRVTLLWVLKSSLGQLHAESSLIIIIFFNMTKGEKWDFLVAQTVKNLPASRRPGFHPWLGWYSEWQPTPVLLPGASHGQRTLAGHSPWGHTESYTTERLTLLLPLKGRNTAWTYPKLHRGSALNFCFSVRVRMQRRKGKFHTRHRQMAKTAVFASLCIHTLCSVILIFS